MVRAESAEHARHLASEEPGDEKGIAWTDVSLSTCVELTADGPVEIVMRDFAAA